MSRRSRHVVEAYLYMSPWLVGYVALTFVPVLLSLYYSFTNYDVISPSSDVAGNIATDHLAAPLDLRKFPSYELLSPQLRTLPLVKASTPLMAP